MKRFTLEEFEKFLKGIDLAAYREKYSRTKIVEMDLDQNIQALETVYEQYWDNIDDRDTPLSFEDYYKIYLDVNGKNIKEFRKKVCFGEHCDCFDRGLEARIYRTWSALITQIHGGLVAESIFGKNSVKMSAELDRKKIDILVEKRDGNDELHFQVKKNTKRPEIARMHKNVENENGNIDLVYLVPSSDEYDYPYYKKSGNGFKKGDIKPFTKLFIKWNPEHGILDRLDNGFVVFTKNAFLGLEEKKRSDM
ncbi:TaqI family restriction endonuclease [Candidatus Saccharibacteria bacterium]|nr:TaqI family restriction endonuclease [Candidatus Saccharibacteria bacterium]